MNKGLDLIKRQQPEFINDFPTGNISIGVTQEELSELEQELKALEIISKKGIHCGYLKKTEDLEEYNSHVPWREELTQEEYDLLKEVGL